MATTRHLTNYPSSVRPFPLEPSNRMIYTRPTHISRLDNTNNRYTRSAASFELLKSEQARLDTFNEEWPVHFIAAGDCAAAGFFYIRDGDKVQCAFCRGVAGEWEPGDIPLVEHKRHFPRCPFICNLPVGNIPLISQGSSSRQESDNSHREPEGIDVCGPFETTRSHLARHQSIIRGTQSLEDRVTSLAITTGNGPQRKDLVTLQSRRNTFTNWPAAGGQNPDTLAEAGFYFLGNNDYCRCFYCGGGLRNWDRGDEPWSEHARWFSKCPFVILNKGMEFVKNAANGNNGLSQASQPKSQTEPEPTTTQVTKLESAQSSSSESSGSASSDEDSTSESEDVNKALGLKDDEIRELRQSRQCKICLDGEVEVVFLPCGHLVSCVTCATALSNCALCRQPIKAVVRTYLS